MHDAVDRADASSRVKTFSDRANVSEVLPVPPSPLGWDVVWEGAAVVGWRDLFVQRLGMPDEELDPVWAEMIGIFGGYAYLGASLFRVWAGRTPGMTPTTIDEVYFGDHPDVPPYVAEDWHANAGTTEVMAGWLGWATTDVTQAELQADREESLRIRAHGPTTASCRTAALLGYVVSLRPLYRRMFHQHINQSSARRLGRAFLRRSAPRWRAALGHATDGRARRRGLGCSGLCDVANVAVRAAVSSCAERPVRRRVGRPYRRLPASSHTDAMAFVGEFDRFLFDSVPAAPTSGT